MPTTTPRSLDHRTRRVTDHGPDVPQSVQRQRCGLDIPMPDHTDGVWPVTGSHDYGDTGHNSFAFAAFCQPDAISKPTAGDTMDCAPTDLLN